MKKKLLWIACTIATPLFITAHASAQQARPVLPVNASQKITTSPYEALTTYSFKLYNAPNNTFGYDILQGGKPVYHQYILTALSNEGKRLFSTKVQAEAAAKFAINKVKKGQTPELSNDELLKILNH